MCSPLLHGGDIETYAPKFLEYVKQADFRADMCSGVDSSFDAV